MRLPIIVVTAVCLSWSTVHAEDYKFPYHDPYLATVTGAVLNADGRTPGLKQNNRSCDSSSSGRSSMCPCSPDETSSLDSRDAAP